MSRGAVLGLQEFWEYYGLEYWDRDTVRALIEYMPDTLVWMAHKLRARILADEGMSAYEKNKIERFVLPPLKRPL